MCKTVYMRTVSITELRAEKGTTEHAFSVEIARVRTSRSPVQITRRTGTPEQRDPARLISHDQWEKLVVEHRPKKVETWGARHARTHLRQILDEAIRGVHTVVTVDGVPSAVFVPTKWHSRAVEK